MHFKILSNVRERLVDSRIIEAKCSLCLIVRDLAGDLRYIPIECSADKVEITEDERLLEIKSNSDDISSILSGERAGLLCLEFVFEQELLVIYPQRQ